MRHLLPLLLLLTACAPDAALDAPAPTDAPTHPPTLTRQATGADSTLFISVHAVDAQTAWLAGTGGTFARTTDGGTTWHVGTVPGADTLQFRDVWAADATTAYLLSIGNGPASRIVKTIDGGATWATSFVNEEPEAFYDCFGFWDAEAGIAFSDAVEGAFPLMVTEDGGATWTRVPPEALPPALPGDGSFAASGTCLTTLGDSTALFGTGNGPRARVFRTTDRGRTWSAAETPLASGPATGIASLTFSDGRTGAALGGDVSRMERHDSLFARTLDGGATWTLASPPPLPSAVYGAAYVPGTPALIAVGPGGLAVSPDDGTTWARLDSLSHWGIGVAGRTGWAAGPQGRVTRIDF